MSMTPERWQQVARVYELVLEQDPVSRDAVLSNACAGDEKLRHEVESLLRQDEAVVILDRSVWATAAPFINGGPDLRPGAVLGPYRIEGPLGGGGMGEIFRATDTRLNRPVAIKTLPTHLALDQQMRARFAREARAVAALAHPHICTLYDVGSYDEVDFLVMEYLEGDTLATRLANGPLPLDLALAHATEIASALDHAHRHGIIHRDLKPANVMLTTGGAKLLDFGVAKFRPGAGAGDVTRVSPAVRTSGVGTPGSHESVDAQITDGGTILGTLRYMAPEQVRGEEVDARSDLFSLGAVLYEMLTGTKAFDEETVAGIRTAILEREVIPVSSLQPLVPPALEAVVRRCLAKDRDNRWRTADEVLDELKQVFESTRLARSRTREAWRLAAGVMATTIAGLAVWLFAGGTQRLVTPPAAPQIRAVAVLPLEDLSGDPEQEYFADGMTEQLIADLATINDLRVISRTSVMYYRNTPKPVPTIARELRVDGIIEGTIVRDGDRVRVTAKLIRGSSGQVLWAQNFERELRDVMVLQREMARTITREVGITLTPQQEARLTSARPINPEAHQQVLLGRHHATRGTEDGLRRSVQYFETAIKIDPGNASAHAGLADAYTGLNGFYMDPLDAMPKARRAVDTALRLDESLAQAHAALGYIHLVYDWDGPAAERQLLRALDLNPTLASARLSYAAFLTSQARYEEAVNEIRRAVDLDPTSGRTHTFGTLFMMFARRYEEAIELARRGLEFEPDFGFTLAFQGVAYAQLGRIDEAVDNLQKAAELDKSPTIRALQAHVLAVAGQKAKAREIVRQVEEEMQHRYFCPYEIGTVYVSLGDQDTANTWFRKGIRGRADCMAWLGIEPWLDPFRSDSRYPHLLREIGLDPSAR